MFKRTRYELIERFQFRIRSQISYDLSELLDASEILAELMLWGMEHLPRTATGNEEADPITSLTTILVRLFNDFEAVKLLALMGLSDQSNGPLRDSIECMMIVRLFQVDPKTSTRWLTHGNEYTPGAVYAELDRRGIAALEYAMYGFLSDRTHPNLMGSVGTAKETDHGGGHIGTEWGLGGYNSPFFIHSVLFQRSLFQLLALKDPLRNLFAPHFSANEWQVWRSEIAKAEEILGRHLPRPDSRDQASEEGVKVAIAKLNRKSSRTNDKLLREMRKMFGDGFNFPD
jgi:hypothetical protein